MCAALNSEGLAAAAVTSDVDALLFGAKTVYRECRLMVGKLHVNRHAVHDCTSYLFEVLVVYRECRLLVGCLAHTCPYRLHLKSSWW